jgi:hypothetical protein
MADKPEAKGRGGAAKGDAAKRPQDPLVERLRPDPSQPPEPSRTLKGLLGDSDRAGFRRLYFTAGLDVYAEFRSDDVLATAAIPPDQPPFLGEEATRVTLRAGAPVDFTQSRRAAAVDEFDLDVRLAGPAGPEAGALGPQTFGEAGCFETFGFGCGEGGGIITFTCATQCADQTCWLTCQTCRTICGGWTCGPTCATCRTACGGATCFRTCQTCRAQCFITLGAPCETRICGIGS